MIKVVDLIVKKEGWTHDEFVEYWLEEHAPVAKELPGLRKYTIDLPSNPERSEYDGVLQLYFDSMDDMKKAFESEQGKRTMDDASTFIDTDKGPTLYLEEHVQLDETNE